MQKIMFNDKYGLTQAVLNGMKTQTRRLVPQGTTFGNFEETLKSARYKIGEEVSIAQSYHDIGILDSLFRLWCDEPGWTNKMFVKADLMPHRIKITDIHIERLKDISDEDCLREGIRKNPNGFPNAYYFFDNKTSRWKGFPSAREAFAVLINKVSGKGTWESNTLVFVYDFILVK